MKVERLMKRAPADRVVLKLASGMRDGSCGNGQSRETNGGSGSCSRDQPDCVLIAALTKEFEEGVEERLQGNLGELG